jgi:hypothetical protein
MVAFELFDFVAKVGARHAARNPALSASVAGLPIGSDTRSGVLSFDPRRGVFFEGLGFFRGCGGTSCLRADAVTHSLLRVVT